MASFTEQATLKVVDQSTAQIRKINAELKKLFATANRLKSFKVDIKVNTGNLTAANRQLNALAHNLSRLRGQSTTLRVNQQGISAASAAITRLRAQAARGIMVNTRHTGGGGGGGVGGGGPPGGPGRRYGGGYGRTPGGAFLGGFGGGIGIGLGRLNESFGVVALAAYGAARALKAVAEAAYARDRAQLAVDTQTSAAQRKVFEQLDAEAKARGDYKGALRYKQDQFNLARASFLGDVGVDEGTKPTSAEGERQRAERADVLARTLYRDVVPGMFARNPALSQQESQEELKKFVQTLGITTQKMFDKDAQGRLKISDDAKRVMEGIRLAQIGAPDLTMGQIRTAAASIKSLGYTATSQQIAEILFNISSKGQRAANEAYQAYKTGMGTVDVGRLNKAISDLGLFIPGTAKPTPPTKKYPEGLIKAGTGVPVEFADEEGLPIKLAERPSEWWRKAMETPEVQKKAREMLIKQASQAPLRPGQTRAQAIAEAKDKYKEGDAVAITDYINRALAGARGTALQGILDSILGGPIAKAGLAQADVAPRPEEINRRMEEAWSVQASNLGTAVSDAAAKLGELAASAIGLSGILKGMTGFVDQHPLIAGSLAIAAGTAIAAAVIVPFTSLTTAGTGLNTAAGALLRAAGALMGAGAGAGLPGGAPTGGGAPTSPGKWGRAGRFLFGAASVAAVAIPFFDVLTDLARQTEEENRTAAAKAAARTEKETLERRKTAIEQAQAANKDVPLSPAMQAQATAEADRLKKINARLQILEAEFAAPKPVKTETIPATVPAATTTSFTKAVTDGVNAATPTVETAPTTQAAITAAVTKAVTEHIRANTPPTVTAAATTTAAAVPTDTLAALIPQLAATSNSITLAVSGLSTAGSNFATVFQTGATAIGNAGQTAASTLSGAAPSIGAAIGNAAANAIKAATANISVNVNVPQTGAAPTGSQKAAN